jgi:hypothetical protein
MATEWTGGPAGFPNPGTQAAPHAIEISILNDFSCDPIKI